MLTLHIFPPVFGIAHASSFVYKADMLLQWSGLSYKTEIMDMKGLSRMPHSKLPVLKDGEKIIPDSELIRQHLKEAHGVDFDAHLSPLEQAQAHAFRRMIENHLYWCEVYSRWGRDEKEATLKQGFVGDAPWFVRTLIWPKIVKSMRKTLHGHGLGRHKEADIFRFGCDDIVALRAQLGNTAFFMGDRFSSVDASVCAILDGIASVPFASKMQEMIKADNVLGAYIKRVKEEGALRSKAVGELI